MVMWQLMDDNDKDDIVDRDEVDNSGDWDAIQDNA